MTDKLQEELDSEDPVMSAFTDLVGRSDFDTLGDAEREEALKDLLKQYNVEMSPEELNDLLEDVNTVVLGDSVADANTEQAQSMANEDTTPVDVTEEDKDSDGDPDKITIEKQNPENDSDLKPSEDDFADFNSSEDEDKPHDEENSINRIASHLSNYRF